RRELGAGDVGGVRRAAPGGAIDFDASPSHLASCRAATQSPGQSKAFRPSTALEPAGRAEGFWRNAFFSSAPESGCGLELTMSKSNVTLFGFPRSTLVRGAGLILTARNVEYRFHDTEDEMSLPIHLERHPFGRVPALQHDDFMLYETNAIAAYIDDVFPGPKLTPADPRKRARMNQWIGNLNWYFY